MLKESFYFSHDYDAQNDPKLQALISKYKAAGYGIYWAIIEMLHKEDSHWIPLKQYVFTAIAKQMLTNAKQVEAIINFAIQECELFVEKDGLFTSNRVLRNFEKREEISQKRSIAGRAGAIAKQTVASAKQNLAKPSKGKERKGKEIKGKINNNNCDSPESPTDFIDELLNIFCEEYQVNRGFEFEIINRGKERKAVGTILQNYKKRNSASPPKSADETRADFRNYFNACMKIPDTWLRENMSPSLIVSKYNEIRTKLSSGKNGKQKTSDDELKQILSKHYGATDNKQ